MICAITRHHAEPNINILLTRNLFGSDVRWWSHQLCWWHVRAILGLTLDVQGQGGGRISVVAGQFSWTSYVYYPCLLPLITILLQLLFYLNDSVRLNTFFILIFFAYFAKSVCMVCYIYWLIHFNYAANIV